MYRYQIQQGERISYDSLHKALVATNFSLLKHIKTGDLYGVPIKPSVLAKRLYRLVGLKCSTAPFKF